MRTTTFYVNMIMESCKNAIFFYKPCIVSCLLLAFWRCLSLLLLLRNVTCLNMLCALYQLHLILLLSTASLFLATSCATVCKIYCIQLNLVCF